MRYTVLLLLFFCLFVSSQAQNNAVDSLLNAGSLKTGSYSIYAIDASTGQTIYSSPQKSLSTASVMKLFTTTVALEVLGPEHTFSTSLYYTGNLNAKTGVLKGNLILKGGADPAFYSSYFEDHYRGCFENWVNLLKMSGIRKIDGKILLDLSALDRTSVPGGWNWDDIGNYYGAGVSALTFMDNTYSIHFSSPETAGKLVTVKSIQPEIPGLKLENLVRSSLISGDHTIVYGAPGSYQEYVEGTIPVSRADFVVRASMPDPAMVAGQTLLKKIREGGISISGGVAKMATKDTTKRILVSNFQSPSLKDLIVPLNKESLNLFAEHLLCEIGRVQADASNLAPANGSGVLHEGESALASGLEAYSKFCKDKGIYSEGFFPADGSGLSRGNALTARTLVETMKSVYDGPNRELFFNAFPVAGVDGTLKNSFKGTPLEKNLKAKTGSMARVRSIAGMMQTKNGKTVLVAIILNNFDLPSSGTSKLLESILMTVYNEQGN
ncbi:MAG TPA: D-alanyl-D-alanine carboxypeptidase/D-alanyl-D-alanine-endopeptidase [Prolixibacteraceae bacterium]